MIEKIYTGVGTRNLPQRGAVLIADIASKLSEIGYTMRSGGAEGSDTEFALKSHRKEIYLPWANFMGVDSPFTEPSEQALEEVSIYAKKYRPNSKDLKDSVKKLYARNIHQVIGYDLKNPKPSEFLVCWADEDEFGAVQGGTGFTVFIARQFNVPVYNLNNISDFNDFSTFLNKKITVYLKGCMRQLCLFHHEKIEPEHLKVIDALAEMPKWTEATYNASKFLYKNYKHLLVL